MVLTIIITSATIIALVLATLYLHNKRQQNKIQTALTSSDSEVKELRSKESQLQEEVTELKHKLQNTFVDPVTQLLGWQLFEDRVRQALKESERHHFTMGLAMVDIDDFKTINDAMGYEYGDAILKEVASRLNECLREVDNVSRFTKDTFVVMLAQLSKPETAAIVAQRILQLLAMPFQMGNEEIHLTACVGVALYPMDGSDTQTLLAHADHALHQAKVHGKQSCQFYEEKMQTQSMRDMQLANGVSKEELYAAFTVLYQPIYSTSEHSAAMLEASLMWQHPELGAIRHDELFYYAEKHRKSNSLSQWMLKQVCEQFMQMKEEGGKIEMLAVPISIKQLENPHFVYDLSQSMQQLQFNPAWLLLELHQHSNPISFDVLEKSFNMLHYLGVKIAINHFGAESLSLRYLKAMKVNYLKLDASFVEDILENPETKTLLKATQQFAQELNMELIVTGVESKPQADILESFGCHLLQGSYYSQPIPLEEEVARKRFMFTGEPSINLE